MAMGHRMRLITGIKRSVTRLAYGHICGERVSGNTEPLQQAKQHTGYRPVFSLLMLARNHAVLPVDDEDTMKFAISSVNLSDR